MLAFMLTAVFAFGSHSQIHVEDTGLFHPLNRGEVLLRPDGVLYVLNFRDALVNVYDVDGSKLTTIGGKGEGPGEFGYPVSFYYEKHRLYVYDRNNNSVSSFDADHRFVERKAFPERNLLIVKVRGGWVYGNWDGRGHEGARQLYFIDHDMTEPKLLLNVTAYGRGGGVYSSTTSEGTTAQYGGISRRAQLVAAADGKTVYLTDPLEFKVRVIDPYTGTVLRTIQKDIEPLPFDEEWAEQRLADMIAGSSLPMEKIKRDYPANFPVIRSLITDTAGNLVFNLWRGQPDKFSNIVVVNPQGEEVEPSHPVTVLTRLAGVHDGHALITTYDNEAEIAGIAKVPIEEAAAFVEANPIIYGDLVTRNISSSSVQ